ncbi:MAG: sigma-E processing peptidase SpoIIGA [Clostridia bacterium]|jgi:stage II sporulation protein GA (sporulation sigma-E factor processing peptidase)|nr:sigma-E processing peptidase SpoIIGA [Clostridia bacterium]
METYVYGDVILLENFIMNFIILWCTARLLRHRHSWLLLSIASLMGAVYALGSYFPEFKYYYTPWMKVIFSLLIITIAYLPNHIKDFAKLTGVFYITSFVFGGAAFGLFYFINGLKDIRYGAFFIKDFPVKTLALSAIAAYFAIKYGWDIIQYRVKREKIIKEINILLDEKTVAVTALIDTGNSLSEPITKAPVVVVEYSSIKELLPKEVQKIFEEGSQDDFEVIAHIMANSELVTRFRVIPFKSLGTDNGMLIGFKPDEIQMMDNNERLNIKNIIVGIYNKKLSNGGEYSALMHPDILNRM